MPIFNCGFYPKKSAMANGAVALAVSIEAKNIKLAEMKATMLLEEAYPDSTSNFFKPKICTDRVGIPRPSIDKFCNEFLVNVAQWNEETKEFESIPLPENTGKEVIPDAGAKKIFNLSADVRIAYIKMYGIEPDTVDREHLSNAYDLINDDEAPKETRALIEGLYRIPQVKSMLDSSVEKLIQAVEAKSPPLTSWPDVKKFAEKLLAENDGEVNSDDEIVDLMKVSERERFASVILFGNSQITWEIFAQVCEYLDNLEDPKVNCDDDEDRLNQYILNAMVGHPPISHIHVEGLNNMLMGLRNHFDNQQPGRRAVSLFIKEWTDNPGKRDELARTSTSTSTSANDKPTSITYDELDTHIALSVAAVHPGQAKAADVRNAKEIKDSRDSVWRAWVKTLRVITGICDVDTDTRHAIISEGLKNPKLLNNDDERLHFVKLRLAGHPACPELAVYGQQPKVTADTSSGVEKTEVHSMGGGMFSIDGLTGTAAEEPKAATKAPITATEPVNDALAPVEQTPAAPAYEELRNRADELEKELAAKTGSAAENLKIWKQVQRTDPTRTKRQETTNSKGEVTRTITSIKPVYQYMRATEIFGPFGIGWGVDVVEERFDRGIPLMEPIIDNAGRETGKKVMRDGDGSIITSLNHTMKITLWYLHGGQRGEITAYGHTKALYSNKFGLTVEEEPSKKSLTDATTKALSSLGFSADVYLGLFEDAEYSQENAIEHGLKNASDKAEESVRLRKELDEKFTKNTETMRSAVTKNEVTQVASSLTRTIGTHIKSAKAVGDTQLANYLDSRLHRLEEIKKECLAKFDEGKPE